MSITIRGYSDDLIEVDGDLTEEFNFRDEGTVHIVVADGTVLTIEYGTLGIWRIEHLVAGTATVTIDKNPPDDTDRYSDVATIESADGTPLRWVALTTEILIRDTKD